MKSSPGERVGCVMFVIAVCAFIFVFAVCKLYGA